MVLLSFSWVIIFIDFMENKKCIVGIIMGSDSDLSVMRDATRILEEFGVETETTIVSAHRTPDRLVEYAKGAMSKGLKVIIAGAGGAAHLPGMVASFAPLPVIGVPIMTKGMEGLDSLLSIVQMPPGIPVATTSACTDTMSPMPASAANARFRLCDTESTNASISGRANTDSKTAGQRMGPPSPGRGSCRRVVGRDGEAGILHGSAEPADGSRFDWLAAEVTL